MRLLRAALGICQLSGRNALEVPELPKPRTKKLMVASGNEDRAGHSKKRPPPPPHYDFSSEEGFMMTSKQMIFRLRMKCTELEIEWERRGAKAMEKEKMLEDENEWHMLRSWRE